MKRVLVVVFWLVIMTPAARSIDIWTGYTRKTPHHGMTKAEVAAYYGEPFHRSVSGQEEQWFYRLKFNEVYGRAWIPFGVDSENIYLGSVTFGVDGKIKRYDWKHAMVH